MAKAVRSKKQANSEKKALAKLRDLGLIPKFDARKKPTRAQKSAINKFSDVLAGKAAVVKPKNPKDYDKLYRRVGGSVIVPRRKGEKITVNKKGEIAGSRRVGGRVVKSRFRKVPKDGEIPRSERRVQYAIPFIRGRDEDGEPILEWQRFPDYDLLKQFMAGYDYKGWTDYVVEEEIGDELNDDELWAILKKRRKGKRTRWKKGKRSTRQSNNSRASAGEHQRAKKPGRKKSKKPASGKPRARTKRGG